VEGNGRIGKRDKEEARGRNASVRKKGRRMETEQTYLAT
jgi:hypothetical protein